ncbi:MAG: Wzz/FepE/Etk N-terminal domain-containing protein [Bacillota bacterium]|nr:Wzz/FepE/Etk N-terminal domain-containing protein [Bacillota bacterium]
MEQERYVEFEEQLDIKELLYIIKKRILLVWLLPVLFAAAAAVLSYFVLKPVYQASISIIISKDQGGVLTQADVMMYQNLIKTYTEIAKSNVVAERAITDGNLKTSAGALQSALTVNSQTGTQVLKMSITSGQPQDAEDKAEAMGSAFLTESRRLLPSGTVEIMDHAKLPQSPVKPNKMLNTVLAFVIGLILAIALAFLMEYMNDTIKSEEDVERYLGVPIIGVIPKHL